MAAVPILLQPTLFDSNPAATTPDRLGVADVEAIASRQILTKANGSLTGYDYSLNPYVGCGFGCSYCFAANFMPDPDLQDRWGAWVRFKSNAVDLLRKKKDLFGKRIFMSSATDPYQPLEAKVELTRRLVEVMTEQNRQPRLVVQTRGPLVVRDIDLFRRFTHLRVNMSLTTDSDSIRRQFEPGCASVERRLQAVTELEAAGIVTTVCVVPMLPLDDPERFAHRLRKTGSKNFVASPFRITDKPFSASTRSLGLDIARKLGWTEDACRAAIRDLQRYLPELNKGVGYDPA
ncbi:MAG TPA: radical SAM protein [Fimbriimonadaceae bacterium]|nr:radical SAM protein [Fimbriimonadaceae bacterium]